MNLKDTIWLSYTDLKEKKVRTLLTILMVVIGVAAIVALVSETAGASASIQKSLSSLGPTSILVTSTSQSGFTETDVADLLSLPNVSVVIPLLIGSGTLITSGQNASVSIIGISQQNLQLLLSNLTLLSGVFYNDTVAPDSLVGYSIAISSTGQQEVFIGQPATLKVGSFGSSRSYAIPVVGILNDYSASILPINTGVIMPLQAAEYLLQKQSFNEILVRASNTASVSSVSTMISDIYGSKIHVLSLASLASTVSSIIGSISMLLLIIAGISLLVAAVGIINIMLMSVMERTREIGIMKSIGMKSRNILQVFLLQALIIGILGGIVGIGVGAGAAYGLSAVISHASASSPSANTTSSAAPPGGFFAHAGAGGNAQYSGAGARGASFYPSSSSSSTLSISPVFTPMVITEALLVAIIVSVIAGIYPAWRASKMEPIDALREL